jgi:hypothetical protein
MTVSMHKMSVEVCTHFPGNLSQLLNHAARYAESRKVEPSALLKARLFPNMYNLTRQVEEANRHAVFRVFARTEIRFAT